MTEVERLLRACPDAKAHRVGGGKGPTTVEIKAAKGGRPGYVADGVKVAHIAVRGPEPHDRVVLGVGYVADTKGGKDSEADVLVNMLRSIVEHAGGGLLGVTTDTVLRGRHIAELSGDLGLLVVNPTAAKSVTVDEHGKEHKTKKTKPLRGVVFDYGNGDTATVAVYTCGGALARATLNAEGEQVLEPLRYRRAVRRANKDGSFRWYAEYEVPCPRGGKSQVILEPTVTSETDRRSGFNRSENVRQIPFHSEQFGQIRKLCSDAESINRGINDALPQGRARSYGYRGVLANALTHALVINSVSRARYRARTAATEQRPAA